MWCLSDVTAEVNDGAKTESRSEEELDLWARREEENAARRIPKIAPSVPPILSTASMMDPSRLRRDPDFAAPLSRS